MKKYKRFGVWVSTVLVACALGAPGHTQEGPATPPAQAVSQTGLLPVYGVDFTFDETWVDGAAFPSQSADYPNSGVTAAFQQIWDNLKPTGFNSIRFPVDVRKPAASANRVANLCMWSKNNGLHVIPILVGSDKGQAPGDDFAANVAAFATALSATLRGAPTPSLAAYSQVLAFQIERQMNHTGLHGPMSIDSAQQRVLQAAAALRKAEQGALKDTGLSVTPILVNASFDHELIKARAIAGATFADDAYGHAYGALRQFLLPIASSSDVDLIGVDWFPGSISAGGVDKLPAFVKSLTDDLSGKQLVVATGFSTAFRSADEQKKFYSLAFANLADYRVSQGVDSPFLGVFFHEALNGPDANAEPPSAKVPADMAQWDWPAKADELAQAWGGKAASDSMIWWQKKVENTMGLLAVSGSGTQTATVTPQPAQQGLTEIARTVTDASNAVTAASAPPVGAPAPATPQGTPAQQPGTSSGTSMGSALKEKAQQGLMSVLDRLFERLGSTVAGAPGSGGAPGAGGVGGMGSGGVGPGGSPSTGGVSIGLSKQDVSVDPATPSAGQPVRFNVTLRNQSSSVDASGLVVAIADQTANAVAYATDVAIARSSTQTLALTWTPADAGTYPLSAVVYDAGLTVQLASAALDSVSVAPASSGGTSSQPTSGTTATSVVNVAKQDVTVTPVTAHQGAPVNFAVTVRNQSADTDTSGLVVAVVDQSSTALAYATDVAVARNSAKTVTVVWTPASAGAFPLSVQVYDAGLTVQMASASLDPMTVGPATGFTGPTRTKLDPSVLGRIKLFSQIGKVPLAVQVGALQFGSVLSGSQQSIVSGQQMSMSVPVTNFSALPISDVTARLLVGGALSGTQNIGTILPKQTRHVVFPVAFARPGRQEVTVVFESGGARPLSTSLVRQVMVVDRAAVPGTPGVRPVLGGLRGAPPAGTAQGSPAAPGQVVTTRPLVPQTFKIGRLSVPAATSAAAPKPPTPAAPGLKLTPAAEVDKPAGRPSTTTPATQAEPPKPDPSKNPSRPPLTLTPAKPEPVDPKGAPRQAGALIALRPDVSVVAADIHCNPSAPAAGAVVECSAVVRNLGPMPARATGVRFVLYVNGTPSAQQAFTVDIGTGPQGTQVAKWSFKTPPGQHLTVEVTATTAQDAQPGNNRATIALGAPNRPLIIRRH
jgi:hypothetical protein